MMLRATGWLRALAFAGALSTVACSDDKPTPPASCSPACSAGYTCTMGACAALCNPPCGAGETCAVRNGATLCVGGGADAGEDAPPADIPPPPQDNPPGVDAPPVVDTPPVMDAPPGDVMRAPCGMTGQPCCGLNLMVPDSTGSCVGTNLCDRATRTCVAYAPETNECTATGECPGGMVCTLGEFCSGGTRSCLRCVARSAAGMLAAGAPCGGTIMGSCADGICANSRCTRTCVPGAAGDAVCRAFSPGTICAEISQSVRLDGGALSNPTTFGACIRACGRDADCMDAGGNLRCGMSVRRIDDTLQLTCRSTSATLTAGANCPLSPSSGSDPMMLCQSGQCFSVPMNMTTGYCSAFCTTDADCPAGSGVCHTIPFIRPSGPSSPSQPIRMCERP